MQELLKKYNVELEDNELEKFKLFLKIFKEKNSQINLSAIRDDKWIIEKHFIDSIMLNVFFDFDDWMNIADLGTWWWFPLIPLAIVNPNVNFTWIDSVWKKLKAIDWFIEELWINNVKTLNWRAEILWQDLQYRESFDIVVSRATAYLPTLLEFVIPLLKVWWIFAAYKLQDKEELTASKKALTRLWAKIMKIKNYEIEWQERTIIFIEKIKLTHKKYPRSIGIPLKEPIK